MADRTSRDKDAVPDVTVSIVNRNGERWLPGLLTSIYASTHRATLEVIVVDNRSTDGSLECIRAYPEARVIVNPEPLGYGASHNVAFRAGRGRYFFVMNNDMVVHDGAIDEMVAYLDAHPETGVLGCRLLNSDGTLQPSCAPESTVLRVVATDFIPAFIPLERIGLREWMYAWRHDSERNVGTVQGSCMMLPRAVAEAMGPFDEGYHFFREEFDLCKRVRNAGYRVMFTPRAEIVHFGRQSLGKIPVDAFRNYQESKYRYFRTHRGPLAAYCVIASAYVGVAGRFLTFAVASMVSGKNGRAAERAKFYRGQLEWFLESSRPWLGARSTAAVSVK